MKRSGEDALYRHCKSPSSKKIQVSKLIENEDYINFAEIPSLQSIAVVTLAETFWKDPSVVVLLECICSYDRTGYISNSLYEAVIEITERLQQKLNKMILPDILKREVSKAIEPIGFQLVKWFVECEGKISDIRHVWGPTSLVSWTTNGILDKVQSLKRLVQSKVKQRKFEKELFNMFKVAGNNCIDEFFSNFYISPGKKIRLKHLYKNYSNHLIALWIAVLQKSSPPGFLRNIMQNDGDGIYDVKSDIYQNMISLCCHMKNAFAFKYFWCKITVEEKDENIEKWFGLLFSKRNAPLHYSQDCDYSVFTHIVCILLSHLKCHKQQEIIFRKYGGKILYSLHFHWQFEKFFLPTFSSMLNYMDKKVYNQILTNTALKIGEREIARPLFKHMWLISPSAYKKHFLWRLSCEPGNKTISQFLNESDVETTELILKDASAEIKKKIIWNLMEHDTFYYSFLRTNYCTLFDGLLARHLSCDQDVDLFKQDLLVAYSIRKRSSVHVCAEGEELLLKWTCEFLSNIRDVKDVRSLEYIYIALISIGDYDRVNQFLSCCFASEEDTVSFKKTFLQENNFNYVQSLMFSLSGKGKSGWEGFHKFINFSFSSLEDISKFKGIYRKCICEVHRDSLVLREDFEFSTLFLNWCFESIDEIYQFKNRSILSETMTRYFTNFMWWLPEMFSDKFMRILKWFSPSEETVYHLKCILELHSGFRRTDRIGQGDHPNPLVILFQILDTYTNG